MAAGLSYDKIIKYQVTATCTEPLHIGSAVGDRGEILVHPVDDRPFIQATSIAGIFREYYKQVNSDEKAEELFGAGKMQETKKDTDDEKSPKEVGYGSRIRFTDGTFLTDKEKVTLELRPRLAIDPVTGTCDSSEVKGTGRRSGHKFDTEYVGAGAKFSFDAYLYEESCQAALEDVFSAVNNGNIQFGGQKSNGCGYIRIDSLKRKIFDMKLEEGRKQWFREDELAADEYEECLDKLNSISQGRNAYEIHVTGSTEGALLVKSAVVTDYGKDAPDSQNIQNAAKDYIVPGSSLKGAVRSQMEKIVSYLKQRGLPVDDLIADTFGQGGDKQNGGRSGNIRFFDTVVGNQEDNDKMAISHRIRIDKFTGGVVHGGKFSEKNIFGQVDFKISILNKNNPDKTCGVLLMALRDMASGFLNVGSGYSVGKGIIQVEKMIITCPGETKTQAVVDFARNVTEDENGIIKKCLSSVAGKEQ